MPAKYKIVRQRRGRRRGRVVEKGIRNSGWKRVKEKDS